MNHSLALDFPDWSAVRTEQGQQALKAAFEAFDMGRRWSGLGGKDAAVWRAVLLAYARTGSAPSPVELADQTRLPADRLVGVLQRLRDRDLIVLSTEGWVVGAYPFTDAATEHRVVLRATVVSAMCAIDALGVASMWGVGSTVHSACRYCASPIEIAIGGRGDLLTTVKPHEAVVWSGSRYADACGATSLCTVQAFFCSDAHLSAWRPSDARGVRLSIEEALQVGRAIFGPMLREAAAVLWSRITCPACGTAMIEIMPTDACQFFYECTGCRTLLRPKKGDCCVFCSYGDVPCPPIQAQRAAADGSDCCR